MNDSLFKNSIILILITMAIMLVIDARTSIRMYDKLSNPPDSITNNNFIHMPSSINCTVVAYSGEVSQTDSDPGLTSMMEAPIPGKTCAVSQDLIHWMNCRIYINGIGIRRVNDLMGLRATQTIDLFVKDRGEAKRFGKKKCQVIFLGR
jgi:3D (Asp-Asp-Asp) domain-containing protein